MSKHSNSPKVDIWESDEAFHIQAEIPGVDEKNVSLQWQDGVLNLLARVEEGDVYSFRPCLLEYESKNFERSFRVSEKVDPDKINAKVKDGLINIRLAKLESCKAKSIEVKAG